MIKNPLISVCMLCYNHEKYVAQSIQSVLDQTYENWELIITDNASTDSSRKIIEEFVLKDERIKFYPLECNSYPSGGINNSIKQSSGEYIAVLSADDYFMPNKLEKQIEFMFANNLEICFTWVKAVNDMNEELITHWASRIFNRNFDNKLDLLKVFINQGNTLNAVTPIISRKLHIEVGLYDNRLLQTQDFDLWLKIINKCPIEVLKEKLTCYRVRDDGNNLSSDVNKNGQIRYRTEAILFMQNVCDLDAKVISQAIDKQCDNESKYKVLFNYYLENHNKAYATAVLLALYNKLGADFSFPSALYQDFFEMYSNFDLFDHFGFHGATSQLFIATPVQPEFNGEHYLSQVFGLGNKYVYSLHKYNKITMLRLDPINQPAKVKLLSAYAKLENDEIYPLELVWHNADLNSDVYDFKHDDPQMVFNIPVDIQADLVSVEFEVEITTYNKWEVLQLLANFRNESYEVSQQLVTTEHQLQQAEQQAHQLNPWNNSVLQLFYDVGQGFNSNHYLQQIAKDYVSYYEFSLSEVVALKGVRLDPLNLPAHVKLVSAQVIAKNGVSYPLTVVWHNANYVFDDRYSFYHDDPILVFDWSQLGAFDYDKVAFEFKLELIEVHELSNFVVQQSVLLNAKDAEFSLVQNELSSTQSELSSTQSELSSTQSELSDIYSSRSWKITQQLRKLLKMFR